MKLSPHFSLSEFTRSGTAIRLGIDNTPSADIIEKLRLLCVNVLEPVREHFGRPVAVQSGYRSPALNKAVGGAVSSQHVLGEAVDFEIPGVANADVVKWILANLKFDQLIAELLERGDGSAGWVHCSWREGKNRNEIISYLGKGRGYVKGFVYAK